MSAARWSKSLTGYPRAARTVLTSVSAWLTALDGSSTKRRWMAAQSSAYLSRSDGVIGRRENFSTRFSRSIRTASAWRASPCCSTARVYSGANCCLRCLRLRWRVMMMAATMKSANAATMMAIRILVSMCFVPQHCRMPSSGHAMAGAASVWVALREVVWNVDQAYGAVAAGSMPPDEPWPADRVALFKRWMDGGCPRGLGGGMEGGEGCWLWTTGEIGWRYRRNTGVLRFAQNDNRRRGAAVAGRGW